MLSHKGIVSNEGIAIGEIYHYKKEDVVIKRFLIEDIELELEKFKDAKLKALNQLDVLYEKVKIEIGENEANIIDVQRMFLEDEDYNEFIINKITVEKVCAEFATLEASECFTEFFSSLEDEYMQARAFDIQDISNRIINNILGIEKDVVFNKPMVIVADDLAPSETVKFEKDKIIAFVTRKGTLNSHTDILAKTMDIPAIINVDIDLSNNNLTGVEIAVDAIDGIVYLKPYDKIKKDLIKKKKGFDENRGKLKELIGKEDKTLCGKHINLYSNIGSVEDVESVLKNDSRGIGLFRSEFLYIGSKTFPTEEEQFLAYKAVAEKMGDKKVIIRTLDIGADKEASYFNIPKEENPAMGYRAIRICLNQQDIFKTQLRALYRASNFGNISIMFPMIISVSEVLEIKEIIKEVKKELSDENIAYKDVEIGIMIETPASVMLSDKLAKEVDFFSVGTNDLTQYTLAVDRQNKAISHMFSAKHESILLMLEIVVKNAHKNGIWAGICGAIASDSDMTEVFLKMGYDELSVTPNKTLEVREKIRKTII